MRVILRRLLLPSLAVVGAACAAGEHVSPTLVIGPGGCLSPSVAAIRPPLDQNGPNVENLGRTIPVKIRVTDCVSGDEVNGLAPTLSLSRLDPDPAQVEVIMSSSAADEGTTLRQAGNGQYLFNLSTKLTRIDADHELTPGVYELRVKSPGQFEDVVVQFVLR